MLIDMRTSLRSQEEVELLPQWCAPDETWSTGYDGPDPSLKAVTEALRTARQTIDVSLGFPNLSAEGEGISSTEETIRRLEVQAALEHYLMAMRRWEIKHCSIDGGPFPPYPQLVLTGYPKSASSSSHLSAANDSCLVVSRSDLLQHLARPHSVTDRFDHPLLFARSGVHNYPHPSDSLVYEPARRSRYVAPASEAWSALFDSPGGACSLDLSLPKVASLQSLLNMLRSILAQAHKLRNLSLTGFMDLALSDGYPTALVLSAVTSVSPGPPPRRWFEPLRLDIPPGCEKLCIAGMRLHQRELEDLVEDLPDVGKLQLSMPAFHSDHLPR